MYPKSFLISSCQSDGGLHSFSLLENQSILVEYIDTGNIRGLTKHNIIYFVKDDCLYSYDSKKVNFEFNLPTYGHDIKFDSTLNVFWFVATPHRTVYKLSPKGLVLDQVVFGDKFWLNCITEYDDKLVIFLSSKRPYPDSKIVVYTKDLKFVWEYNCNPKDEIHSPVLFQNYLYWCISNKNLVVRGSLDDNLFKIETVIQNNNGYTRGLYIDDDFLLVGTSENRHSENCQCVSNIHKATINVYREKEIVLTKVLSCKEVYDIC